MTPTIYIGAHINREKTIVKTMEAITKNGGNCLQLFVSNPRSASLVNIDNYINTADDIKEYSNKNNFKTIIHSSYTINFTPLSLTNFLALFFSSIRVKPAVSSI